MMVILQTVFFEGYRLTYLLSFVDDLYDDHDDHDDDSPDLEACYPLQQ